MEYTSQGATTTDRVCMARQPLIDASAIGARYVYDGVETTAAFCDGALHGLS